MKTFRARRPERPRGEQKSLRSSRKQLSWLSLNAYGVPVSSEIVVDQGSRMTRTQTTSVRGLRCAQSWSEKAIRCVHVSDQPRPSPKALAR